METVNLCGGEKDRIWKPEYAMPPQGDGFLLYHSLRGMTAQTSRNAEI